MTKDGVAFDAARFVRRLARALLGKDVPYLPQWWIHSTRLGRPGAAFRVCPSAISRDSVVYSFGAGEDISFDIELIRRFGVSVHSFDPTPKSIAWLRTQTLPPQFVFHDYGLAHFDGTAAFAPPSDPRYVSYSVVTSAGREVAVKGTVYRLQSIMRMLGHGQLDVLKMDIEGAEYDVIADLLASGPLPRQLLVEFHHRWAEVGLERTKHAVAALRSKGYRLFAVSASGTEYGFVLGSGRPIDDAITNAPAGREWRGRARP